MATKFHNIVLSKASEKKSKSMEKYTFIKQIGSGSFGKVFLVKSKQRGINYVVKKVDLKKLDKKQSLAASKEVELLSKLRHNNIVSYKESYEKNNELNIVLEYCENGDLHNKIKEKRISNKFFSENEILDYFVQISLALEYIHSQKILHRDLKTKNIFLTKGNVIKLGDFGIAKTLENSFELAQTCIGSPFYLSPEICESKPYNKKSDIWALGCVLYELATLKYAFVTKNVKTLVTRILAGAYNPLPANTNIHIRNLITCMLKPNPADRPSVKEILQRRYLIKRRAAFISKAYRKDFSKRRSKSNDNRNLSSGVIKNEIYKSTNIRKLSLSYLELNQLKDFRQLNEISNPKAKYNPLNIGRNLQNDKCKSLFQTKNENCDIEENNKEPVFEPKRCSVCINPKNTKLPKVYSEYYDLIAGQNQNEHFEKKDDFVGKQNPHDEFDLIKINVKPDPKKMRKILNTRTRKANETEESGDLPHMALKREKGQSKEKQNLDTGHEHRKRWSKDTHEREALLAIFKESKLLGSSLTDRSLQLILENSLPRKTIDEMLRVSPSELTVNVLEPVKLYEIEPKEKNQKKENHYFQLLQHEIEHLREKFESNNRKYQIEDLMRLTDNCKNILKLKGLQQYAEYDKKMDESIYHDLECQRMSLEQKIGFSNFSQIYKRMMKIIRDEVESAFKQSLEKPINPTETYIIKKVNVAGDNDDLIKNTWKSIIGILEDKQEYLPDVWELAMSENIYYHL